MRWLVAAALALLTTVAYAQQNYPSAPASPQGPLLFTPLTVINVTDYGFNPGNSGALNYTNAASVVAAACAAAQGAKIVIPPGNYAVATNTTPAFAINCNNVNIECAGRGATVITPTGTGDVIAFTPPGGATYGFNSTIKGCKINRSDSPGAGRALFLDHWSSVTLFDDDFEGEFTNLDCNACYDLTVLSTHLSGLETQTGSSLMTTRHTNAFLTATAGATLTGSGTVVLSTSLSSGTVYYGQTLYDTTVSATTALGKVTAWTNTTTTIAVSASATISNTDALTLQDVHPNGIKIIGSYLETSASNSPYTYDYALFDEDSGGLQISNSHLGWVRLADIYRQPQFSTDELVGFGTDSTTVLDSNGGNCFASEPYGAVILNGTSAVTTTLNVSPNAPSNVNGYLVSTSGYASGTTVISGQGTGALTLSNSVGANGISAAPLDRVVLYPTTFTGTVSQMQLHGGCNGAALNGVQIDDPSVTRGGWIDLNFSNVQQAAINIVDGGNYVITNQFWNNDLSNNGWPTIVSEGNASNIQIPWASFATGSGITPPEHIMTTGQAVTLLGNSLTFTGATAQISNNSTAANPGNLWAYSPAGATYNVESWTGHPAARVVGVASSTPGYLELEATGGTYGVLLGAGNASGVHINAQAGSAGAGGVDIGSDNGDPVAYSTPTTVSSGPYTVLTTDSNLIFNGSGSITITLPSVSTYTGRTIRVRTIAAQTVISASSNVVPLAGGAAGTAILAATAGKWALLQSDGSHWNIIESN